MRNVPHCFLSEAVGEFRCPWKGYSSKSTSRHCCTPPSVYSRACLGLGRVFGVFQPPLPALNASLRLDARSESAVSGLFVRFHLDCSETTQPDSSVASISISLGLALSLCCGVPLDGQGLSPSRLQTGLSLPPVSSFLFPPDVRL